MSVPAGWVPLTAGQVALLTPAERVQYLRLLRAVDVAASAPQPEPLPDSPGALAARLTEGREQQRPHLSLIDQALIRAAEQGGQRIIVNVGPRYGKTRRAARWGTAWRLQRNPESRVILTSYGADLSEESSRWVRDRLEQHDLGVRPRRDSRAVDRWYLDGHEGGVLAVGIGGGITGFGADLLLIDDVIKDAEQAMSKKWLDRTWRWYTETAYDRLEPGGSVVVIMTRWNENDLTGRLLREQPGVWTVIRIPTVAEAADPLDRKPGELLWPGRYDQEAVEQQRMSLGAYAFAARHQQDPRPRTGGVWEPDWIEQAHSDGTHDPLELAAALYPRCVALDPSASENAGGDEAGIVCAGREKSGLRRHWIVADLSGRLSPDAWARRALVAAVELDCDIVYESNLTPVFIRRTLKQAWEALQREAADGPDDDEPGWVPGMVRRVVGVGWVALSRLMPAMKPVRAKVGKLLRAEPVAQLYEQNRVRHANVFVTLESQQLTWRPSDSDSPDRLDAAVHALTWLGDAARQPARVGSTLGMRVPATAAQ